MPFLWPSHEPKSCGSSIPIGCHRPQGYPGGIREGKIRLEDTNVEIPRKHQWNEPNVHDVYLWSGKIKKSRNLSHTFRNPDLLSYSFEFDEKITIQWEFGFVDFLDGNAISLKKSRTFKIRFFEKKLVRDPTLYMAVLTNMVFLAPAPKPTPMLSMDPMLCNKSKLSKANTAHLLQLPED